MHPAAAARRHARPLGAGLTAAALGLLTLGTATAHAATIPVPCTGSNSVNTAALDAAIVAAMDGDTITLGAGCTFSYSSTAPSSDAATPLIQHVITILGNGDTVTRTGSAPFGIFEVSGGGLTLEDTIVTNGLAEDGGAVFNNGAHNLTLIDDTFRNDTASIGGAVSAEHEAGGAPTLIENSLFADNTSDTTFGGGLSFDTPTTIINSTFTGNTAPQGGGLYSNGGTGTLINDTIAGNTALGSPGRGHVALINDGGGINDTQADVTLVNTIVSGNTDGNCSDAGNTVDGGHNLESGTSCAFHVNNVSTDPQLGALANNGGPSDTMAITVTSSAYHVADPAVCSATMPNGAGGVDQRGKPRFSPAGDGVCDIGAFAVQAVAATPTPTGVPVPPTGAVDGSAGGSGAGLVLAGTAAVALGIALMGVARRRREG